MTTDPTRPRSGPLRRALTGMVCLAAAACGGSDPAGGGGVPAAKGAAASVTKDGIRLSFAIEHADPDKAGQPWRRNDKVRISFQITDEVAGEGLNGLHLGAWLTPRLSTAEAPDEAEVRNMVRKLVASDFGSGTWTNLNTFFFLTSSADKTVSLMDPLLDSARTRIKDIVQLPGLGVDMAFGPNDEFVFVTVPETGQVAVIDTASMALSHRVAAGTAPTRIERQPRTGNLWVSDDAGEQVFVIDGFSTDLVKAIDVGPGPKWIAFDGAGRYAFLCARDTGAVVQVETRGLAAKRLGDLGGAVSGLAYSDAAGALYACMQTGKIEILEPDTGERRSAPSVPAGSGPIYADRDGRWLFALERDADRVHILDLATNQESRVVQTGAKPIQMVFTDAWAHVHCAGKSELTSIQVSALSDPGSVPVSTIPIGQKGQADPDLDVVGDQLAVPPTDNAVVVAQPEEKQLYYYAEGMFAPKGAYQNHSTAPLAVAVVDRSLRETGNGIYTTVVPLDYYGKVDVYTYLNDPTQMFGHFEIDIEPDPETVRQRKEDAPKVVPRALEPERAYPLGDAVEFRFELVDPESGERVAGLKDVWVQSFNFLSTAQQRSPAEPQEDGSYKVDLRLTRTGFYEVRVQAPSANMTYTSQAPLRVTVTDKADGGPPGNPPEKKSKESKQ